MLQIWSHLSGLHGNGFDLPVCLSEPRDMRLDITDPASSFSVEKFDELKLREGASKLLEMMNKVIVLCSDVSLETSFIER